MNQQIERRIVPLVDAEIREMPGAQTPTIVGYAAVFGASSEVMADKRGRPFREQIAATAFDRSLNSGADVLALWNHDPNFPLGRRHNGTLRLSTDVNGLRVEIDPPDTQAGRDAVVSIRRGDVNGMSFAFATLVDDWSKDTDGLNLRTLVDVDLIDVSPTPAPAYPATIAAVRGQAIGSDIPDGPDDGQEPGSVVDEDLVRMRHDLLRRRLALIG